MRCGFAGVGGLSYGRSMSLTAPVQNLRQIESVDDFRGLLQSLTGIEGVLNRDVERSVRELIERFTEVSQRPEQEIAQNFYGRINQKLTANRESIASLYSACANAGLTFNYKTKRRLEWSINTGDVAGVVEEVITQGASKELVHVVRQLVTPISQERSRELLAGELVSPTKLRRQPDRDVSSDVFNSAAGSLVWSLWNAEHLVAAFNASPMPFTDDYMRDLRAFKPSMFARQRSLVIRRISPLWDSRSELLRWLSSEYQALDNYGFVAAAIQVDRGQEAAAWSLASDLPLFAERFIEDPLQLMYFRWKNVAEETMAHGEVDAERARFDLNSDGFTYRDTFVFHDSEATVQRIVVLLQKNHRDEEAVPCPGCRTDNIGGNSYPSFGVKSWECQNPLCPERSIYNRGKRYDFRALLKQEAIERDGNQIPIESVRSWQRDVIPFESDDVIVENLIRHYSMRDDVVALMGGLGSPLDSLGRTLSAAAPLTSPDASTAEHFWHSPFFHRYLPVRNNPTHPTADPLPGASRWEVKLGDALEVLGGIPDEYFDRAITSPPYFNARDYAQWPNLYCYLRDMYQIADEVYRTLKPGGIYAYNIFDYFDNERIVTFSDMGKKRILLSALMVDEFRRIGFEYLGTSVWDKGEIQGKRGFNAGNFSPFYQAPFNCWEHVLVVRKPGNQKDMALRGGFPALNEVLRIRPVWKMVRGTNVLGHTAPYPIELVDSALDGLPSDAVVLDPFGGSGTTARAAVRAGHRAVLIERDATYVDLSKRLISDESPYLA
jgi:DNA modification methylase